MLNVEKICNTISQMIGHELNYSNDKIEVINYGLFAFIQTLVSILLIIIFGAIFNVLNEALIIAFTASILRKYSGGIHASTPEKCAIIGTIISVSLALIIHNVKVSYRFIFLIGIIVFILSFYIVYKLAPVDSSAKPIKKIENISRLKMSSILILTLYLIIVLLSLIQYIRVNDIRFLIYSLCIYAGILWQTFTLTKSGHKFLHKIDALF